VAGQDRPALTPARGAWALLSLLLILLAWWGMGRLDTGLEVRDFVSEGVALRFIVPETPPADGQGRPAVIIGHGFSVAQQIMLGYGYHLARAGYAVMLLDFPGHGRSALALQGNALQVGLDTAYRALVSQPGVDPERIALLGQSMGSGVVMAAGVERPDRFRAVVAISPTDASVSESRPPNLMLQAGQLEGRFVTNAHDLLARAGGPSDDFEAGLARTFVEIPWVEHVSILFSARSQDQARSWLDRAFGLHTSSSYRETRLLWLGLNVVGWLSLALALAPLAQGPATAGASGVGRRGPWRAQTALAAGTLTAVAVLARLSRLLDLSGFLGMAVGGALAIWFVVMGAVWLWAGFRPGRPRAAAWVKGLALFGLLWLALGLAAEFTVLSWFLNGPRLVRWPLLALACLPWQLAAGHAQNRGGLGTRLAWWLGQSLFVAGGLVVTALVAPGMFILVLMAPVIPLVLAAMSVAAAAMDHPWAYGIGSALFFGWLLAALFPLV
jgi:pimeloyl-ACP methyl ester carboxylesterase